MLACERGMDVPKDKVDGIAPLETFLGEPRWPFPGGQHLFSGWRMGDRSWRCPALKQIKITPTTPRVLFGSGAFDWRESCRSLLKLPCFSNLDYLEHTNSLLINSSEQ